MTAFHWRRHIARLHRRHHTITHPILFVIVLSWLAAPPEFFVHHIAMPLGLLLLAIAGLWQLSRWRRTQRERRERRARMMHGREPRYRKPLKNYDPNPFNDDIPYLSPSDEKRST
jgi:hypothetical protein